MKSGIYKIECVANNKVYIGSSKNIQKRICEHVRKLKNNIHHSIVLQRSWNKYKEENFIYLILEKCEIKDLLNIENKYLQLLNPQFNISKNATSVMLGRKHSKQTLAKFKNRKTKTGSAHHLFGTKWNERLRKKMILSRTGLKRDDACKRKMSETAKRINSIGRIDHTKRFKSIKDNKGNTFNSLTSASEFHKIHISIICDNLKGRSKKTRKGIIFKYV